MCQRIRYYSLSALQHNRSVDPNCSNVRKLDLSDKPQLNTLVKLSYSLCGYPASFLYMDSLKEIVGCRDIILKPVDKTGDLIDEIEHACLYLLSDEIAESDVARSSRWFRMNVPQSNASAVNRVGFKKYRATNTAIDSVLVANYIKKRILDITNGLVPQALQSILIDILQPYVDEDGLNQQVIAAVYGVLSVNPQRLKLLRLIADVANRIFEKCTIDPIKPEGLARIIKVSKDESLDWLYNNGIQSIEAAKELVAELDSWNNVWGLLLSESKLFMYQVRNLTQDAFDHTLDGSCNALRMYLKEVE